jgi:hypothetical protein
LTEVVLEEYLNVHYSLDKTLFHTRCVRKWQDLKFLPVKRMDNNVSMNMSER